MEKRSDQLVYDIIFQCLRKAVENGDLTSKSVLPSTRELAKSIKVSSAPSK